MRRLLLGLGLAFSAPAAFAANIRCTGNYMMYGIEARTKSTNTSITAPIIVSLNGPFGSSNTLRLDAETSDVRVGQYIHIQAKSPQGNGALTATFAGGNVYNGTLAASTGMGNIQINVSCTMVNAWNIFGGY